MSSFEFPKQNKSQSTGYSGESFFQYFISNSLGWIYRLGHQESDSGIDGYIDIVCENCVTGKSIAVQILEILVYLQNLIKLTLSPLNYLSNYSIVLNRGYTNSL